MMPISRTGTHTIGGSREPISSRELKNNQLVIKRTEFDQIMEKAKGWTKESEKSLFKVPHSRMYKKIRTAC